MSDSSSRRRYGILAVFAVACLPVTPMRPRIAACPRPGRGRRPITGPCLSGWMYRTYVKDFAG
jgi:hypothetical protein